MVFRKKCTFFQKKLYQNIAFWTFIKMSKMQYIGEVVPPKKCRTLFLVPFFILFSHYQLHLRSFVLILYYK